MVDSVLVGPSGRAVREIDMRVMLTEPGRPDSENLDVGPRISRYARNWVSCRVR